MWKKNAQQICWRHLSQYTGSRFVVEVRREDGQRYPVTSLYQMLAGLLRYSRSINRDCPNFLDKKDGCFSELTRTCESVARELRKQGVGAQVKHAQFITPEEVMECRSNGNIQFQGFGSCCVLQCWEAFCFSRRAEQRSLKPSQFVHEYDPDYYT